MQERPGFMFKNKSTFYVKTLAVYATVLALLYCSNMQYEQKYNDSRQLDAIEKTFAAGEQPHGEPSGYPYARMYNAIGQVRSLERDYNFTVDSDQLDDDKIAKVLMLEKKIAKVSEKLKQERSNFVDFVSISRFKEEEDSVASDYLCSKGRCRYSTARHSALSRKDRNQKSARYTCQVLNEYLERLEIMSVNLKRLVEQARLRDEAAKAKSEKAAKKKMEELGSRQGVK